MTASDRQIFARVLDTTTSTVIVDDPGSLVYSALNAEVQGFVIVDLKASLLGIEASSVYSLFPLYDVNTDTTSIVAASALFNSGMLCMAFFPNRTPPMNSEYSPSRFEPHVFWRIDAFHAEVDLGFQPRCCEFVSWRRSLP